MRTTSKFNKRALEAGKGSFLNAANRWRNLQSPTQTEREKDIRDIFWKLFPLYFAFSGERRLTFKELGGTFQPNTLTNYILS